MKYLDNPLLLHLSNSLSNIRTPETRIYVRFEAYSVKPMRQERKMYKEMEEAYMSGQEEMEEMSFSPEMREAGLSSCFGRLDEKESRKVHFLLVSTLNSAFPDHDFHALQPNQFTREVSATDVLSNVTTSLLGPGTGNAPMIFAGLGASALSPPQLGTSAPGATGSSPNAPHNLPNPHIYRVLNEVVPLDECEVYSWFPEPEYDPHIDAEDGEISDDGWDSDSDTDTVVQDVQDVQSVTDSSGDIEMEIEPETPASWGAGGMELDDVPTAPMMLPSTGKDEAGSREGRPKRGPGLLWSQNYFFYAKRMKRVLFCTCWCRKRPSQFPPPAEEDGTSFPLPISSSFTPTSPVAQMGGSVPARPARVHRTHNRSNARPGNRKSKLNLKTASSSRAQAEASTIPIRGMESTPRPSARSGVGRLASSAPTPAFNALSPQAALAKMKVGGYKPKQTPARVLINAASATNRATNIASPGLVLGKSSADTLGGRRSSPEGEVDGRVRKERSKSTTPSANALSAIASQEVPGSVAKTKGKRVKV